jgi:hypothetical protein
MSFSLAGNNKTELIPSYSNKDMNIQHVQESSDIAQTIKELNDDKIDEKTSFSNIDMKSRLMNIEISSIIALDSLVALDFLPPETSFITRSKKRLAVSQNGLGRTEVVQIAQGMNQNKNGTSFLDRIGNVFRGGTQ